MSSFPVTSSVLSSHHLSSFISEHYEVSNATTCQLLRSGINDTYLVTYQSTKYVFRIYSLDWRTLAEIEAEIDLLTELRDQGLSVSYPIPDRTGKFIHTLNAPEGSRFAVLFSYADGEKLHDVSVDTHYAIGQLMARFHQCTLNRKLDRVVYTPEYLLIESLEKLYPFISKDCDEMGFMRDTQAHLLQLLRDVDSSKVRFGGVHLDIWFDNLNISADNKVTLFDFDFCGNGWQALDVGYYIMQLHNVEKYESAAYQPKVDSFLKGYDCITPLHPEEKRLLPALGLSIYFFYLGIQCERFENFSNIFMSENYLKRFIKGVVKRYYDLYLS
jgi:Ser/Thr protein kinase RdoA (MazF antagonist)